MTSTNYTFTVAEWDKGYARFANWVNTERMRILENLRDMS